MGKFVCQLCWCRRLGDLPVALRVAEPLLNRQTSLKPLAPLISASGNHVLVYFLLRWGAPSKQQLPLVSWFARIVLNRTFCNIGVPPPPCTTSYKPRRVCVFLLFSRLRAHPHDLTKSVWKCRRRVWKSLFVNFACAGDWVVCLLRYALRNPCWTDKTPLKPLAPLISTLGNHVLECIRNPIRDPIKDS